MSQGRKADNACAVGIAIKELDRCANQAREAVAAVFCVQVMRTKLDDTLPEHAKRTLLETLGVDVDALSSVLYNQELIRDRLGRFRENNARLRRTMETVLEDANFVFETTEQAW